MMGAYWTELNLKTDIIFQEINSTIYFTRREMEIYIVKKTWVL